MQEEQKYSEIQSALVNKAYKTLLKPLSRGLYMVSQIHGFTANQQFICHDGEAGREEVEPSFDCNLAVLRFSWSCGALA